MKKLIPLLLLVPLVLFAAGCDLAGITITPSTQASTISSFGADPLTIAAGESSTLSWNVTGAATVSIDQGIGNVALSGSRAVMPSVTTVYTLTATNATGTSITATAQVIVIGAPSPPASLPLVNSFAASPPSITVGELATLSWNVSNATSVTIDHGVGTFASSGTTLVSPATTTTYILTATNAAGNTTATTQVIVSGAPSPPGGLPVVNHFTADPPIISAGSSTTLSWSVSNSTSVTIDPGVGSVGSAGTTIVSPATSISYTLTAANAYGLSSLTIGVLVTAAPPPVPAEYTVTFTPIVAESGYVRDTGQVTPKYMYVGDDNSDLSLQAFLSFNISSIPAGATINEVVVDFTDYYTIYGDPFSSLGCLRAYVQNYGALDSSDYWTGSTTGAVIRYCSVGQILAASDPEVKAALQAQVGSSRFKLRLQFNETETDNGHDNDLVCWTPDHLPKLIVNYTAP